MIKVKFIKVLKKNTTQTFKDVDFDEISIWKFDDDNSSDTKDKKKEDSTDSTTRLSIKHFIKFLSRKLSRNFFRKNL